MINQLSKFSPHLADQVKPLRDLLSSKNEWLWETAQESAFTEVKKLQSPEALVRYNPSYETMVSADASSGAKARSLPTSKVWFRRCRWVYTNQAWHSLDFSSCKSYRKGTYLEYSTKKRGRAYYYDGTSTSRGSVDRMAVAYTRA